MAAPVDSARVATNVTTAAATWNVNVGSPVAGTLVIVYLVSAAATGGATFTGYSEIMSPFTGAFGNVHHLYWRWADGTEGASDVWDPVNSVKGAAISWEVTGAANESPAVSTNGTHTTVANTANPPSVAPTSPPQDTLYIAVAGGDGEVGAYTAAPTNYANIQAANSGTGGSAASNVFIGGASRQLLASSSDDPGTFTHAAHTNGGSSFAIAIRPPQAVVFQPRHGFVNHVDPGVLMKGIRRAWHRRRSGIFVPDLWTPEGVIV